MSSQTYMTFFCESFWEMLFECVVNGIWKVLFAKQHIEFELYMQVNIVSKP